MEKEYLKRRNRSYLRRVFTIKTLFYPLIIFLARTGLIRFIEPVINKITGFFGVKKNVHYFFKYRDYGKLFSGRFRESEKEYSGEILFPVMTGVHSNFTLLNLLLSLYYKEEKKLRPVIYICDSALPVCTKDGMLKSREMHPFFCYECWKGYEFIESETGIDTLRMSHFLSGFDETIKSEEIKISNLQSVQECYDYKFREIRIGLFARKSVLRYFLTGKLSGSDEELNVYRRFLIAGVKYSLAFEKLLNERPGVKYVILNNGSLTFEAIAREHCAGRKISYMTYETYIGNNSLIYKKNGAVMDLDWRKEYEIFCRKHFTDETTAVRVKEFFENLKKGVGMYALLNEAHNEGRLKDVKRYATLFTNLNFDTAVIDKNFLFANMEEWILEVIDFWKKSETDITLVIRIHPGELKLVTASREFLGDRIANVVGADKRIILFDSTDRVNSYELIGNMEYGLIYSSTIGLEIAWAGKPCLVAGLPWFRDKSFIIYPDNRSEYFEKVKALNEGSLNFIPDREELIRTIDFVYFNRLKRFNGIKLYTPAEEPNTVFDDPETMIRENRKIFDEFSDELPGTAE